MKFWLFSWASPPGVQWRVGKLVTPGEVEFLAFHSVFSAMIKFVLYDAWLGERLLSKSFLSCYFALFLSVLWLDSRLFSSGIFVCACQHFQVAGSPVSSLGTMRQKENPGYSPWHCSLHPKVPNQSTFVSTPFSHMLILHIISTKWEKQGNARLSTFAHSVPCTPFYIISQFIKQLTSTLPKNLPYLWIYTV